MEVQFDLRAQDIENLVFWAERLEEKKKKKKRFWDYDNLIRRGTLAKAWTAGYTITLDQFSVDITEVIRKKPPEIIGHQEELESLERILSRQEGNNVLLVGEPGSGRKSIVYALAKKSLFGQSLSEVNYKRVVFLNLSKLLAQISSQEEVEFILDTIFQETARAGNVILVIDELHNYISQTSKLGTIDISAIISSYLHLPQFQIIGITTYKGLHTAIEQNFSFVSLFEKVEVSEIKKKETLLLLQRFALDAEEKNKILISYPAIREIVNLSERYFPNLPFPEKAIDILDEVSVAAVQKKKKKIVLPSDVEEIMSEKSQIPIGELKKEEKEKLLNLEKLIHRRIVNQNKAVNEIALAMRRARVDISGRKKPIGGFLFLGPTGVGKTETSKALAEIYFGSEEKMIRLDMSEFQKISDIDRLLGKPGEEGLLTTPVRENPFSLVLLDELEKAHPDILNLFLQILDEGRLTDGQGRKVDFKNTIIIATSNAGYKIILEAIEKNKKWEKLKKEMLDYLFEKGIFRPELINRFDGVVIFRPLTKENLLEIADLMLQRLKRNLKEKGIEFVITLELKEKIVELGYNPIFGAREMKRIIQDKVENALAQAILKGDLKRGQSVEVIPSDFSLKIY
ncbi:MAG TPA: ATP-dependent Clp protease ATP-binding subunit [Candidatus Parcubacteria bacterium]|nr:ATP-dependent Clp protease ATP-binding subunit [Candidatus Parcubacteria bacterium]